MAPKNQFYMRSSKRRNSRKLSPFLYIFLLSSLACIFCIKAQELGQFNSSIQANLDQNPPPPQINDEASTGSPRRHEASDDDSADGDGNGGDSSKNQNSNTTTASQASKALQDTSGKSTTTPLENDSDEGSDSGLSAGAKAGLAIGLILAGIGIIVLTGYFFRQLERGIAEEKKRQRAREARKTMTEAAMRARYTQNGFPNAYP